MPKKKPHLPAVPEDTSMDDNPNRIEVRQEEGESKAHAVAKAMLRPVVGAAITTNAFRPGGLDPVPLPALIKELSDRSDRVCAGETDLGEAMLVAQAHTLDAIFNCLAQRASMNVGHHMGAVAEYMRLALKAQAQARVTWEAVSSLKNPSRIYAKQANIAHNQQVNNGTAAPVSGAGLPGEDGTAPNEVLEVSGG